ncbi:MAG: L-threonylcarbamoyladenylate synthase, partial [Christensenellaceae bacterium]
DGCIDAIIDGGDCRVGVESTVLSLGGTPTVLRPGGVTREMLESVIGHVDIAHAVLNPLKNGETAASPGMKYKHYAPECDVVIADGGNDCKKTASIACREYTRAELSGKKCTYCNGTNQIPLSGSVCYRRQDSTADAVRRPFS